MGRRGKPWYSQLFSDFLTHRRRKRKADRYDRRRDTRWKLEQEDRDRKRQAREARAAAAERQTTGLQVQIAEIEGLLGKRRKDWYSHRAQLDEIYRTTSAERFAKLLGDMLISSRFPPGFPRHCRAAYDAEQRELLLEYDLPRLSAIPTAYAYVYVVSRDVVKERPARRERIEWLYRRAVARTVLRALAEAFAAAPGRLVDRISLDGYVPDKDRSTGRPVRPRVISVRCTRTRFAEIDLDEPEMDPSLAVRKLGGRVSRNPHAYVEVEPVRKWDVSTYKFADSVDVHGALAGLDGRPDLLKLDPYLFENLVRELFEKMGYEARSTRRSGDGGVDVVAVDANAVSGGVCMIQVKRYKGDIKRDTAAALLGDLITNNATTGMLVTTSWLAPATRALVDNDNRLRAIEGRELKYLLKEHCGIDCLISLPKLPPGWRREDVS